MVRPEGIKIRIFYPDVQEDDCYHKRQAQGEVNNVPARDSHYSDWLTCNLCVHVTHSCQYLNANAAQKETAGGGRRVRVQRRPSRRAKMD